MVNDIYKGKLMEWEEPVEEKKKGIEPSQAGTVLFIVLTVVVGPGRCHFHSRRLDSRSFNFHISH